jgi:hypothetical protein
VKKIFPIIGHVFLGVILLVFFCVVSLMLFDSQQEHYLWISLALSILLSIIIPIRLYIMREDTKKKNPEGITFGNILIFLLWQGICVVIPLAVFIKVILPLIEAIFGLGVTIIMCIGFFLTAIVVWKDPKAIEKYNKAKKKETLL